MQRTAEEQRLQMDKEGVKRKFYPFFYWLNMS